MKAAKPAEWESAATRRLHTFGQWWRFAQRLYERDGLALGQVAGSVHDETLYLLLRVLDWPLESGPEVLKRRLSPARIELVRTALRRRVGERVPAAYITREALLGGKRFYVDERVIIPRSYFVELIPAQLEPWLPAETAVRHVADVCTGSGCLAILLAEQFPKAKVDAVDLSADALAVAAINPARVLALVQMLRRHVVQIHTLRLSNVERDSKTDALYEFIRSERCLQLFARVDGHAESLLKLQAQEKRAHDTTWKRQGTVYRAIQKDGAELSAEIDRIINAQDESN